MSNIKKPTVLIVGAGLGGLLLGALLERAEISYTIFERALVVRPLGIVTPLPISHFYMSPASKGSRSVSYPLFFLSFCLYRLGTHHWTQLDAVV